MRTSLVAAVIAAALVVTGQTVLAPPARAAAINVSAASEHRIRLAVNRYAEIQVAQREPYCYGGTGPDCFDCSGLVVAAYRYAGVRLPARTSTQMRSWTTGTSLRYARTGDLLIYSGHVELFYRKNGSGPAMAVSATHTGGPPVNFHPIRRSGLIKVGKVVT
ncbi:MAG TPA: NlpC/P60 family protein [Actinomycetota bacterium]|jgi:cell wall-associated NlpC family hydrolase|nr:NlpC/P60 family protein [Actinomycetota bacterium]